MEILIQFSEVNSSSFCTSHAVNYSISRYKMIMKELVSIIMLTRFSLFFSLLTLNRIFSTRIGENRMDWSRSCSGRSGCGVVGRAVLHFASDRLSGFFCSHISCGSSSCPCYFSRSRHQQRSILPRLWRITSQWYVFV